MASILPDDEAIGTDASLGPRTQLQLLVLAHVSAVADNRDALTVYLHEFRALAGDSLDKVRAQRDRYAQLVSETVGRGVRLGEFETADVGIATLGLLGMCNWVCQWYQPDGRLGPA